MLDGSWVRVVRLKQSSRVQKVKASVNSARCCQGKCSICNGGVHMRLDLRRSMAGQNRAAQAGPKTPRWVARMRDSGATGRVDSLMWLEKRGFLPLI